MTYFAVDDGFWAHPKTDGLSDGAVALWTKAGSWSSRYLTDGKVPARTIAKLGHTMEQAEELVHAGLWAGLLDGVHCGFLFHQWQDHQPTKESVEKKRARWRSTQRGKRAAESLRNSGMSTLDTTEDSALESKCPSPSPSPSPVPEEEKSATEVATVPPKAKKQNAALIALKAALKRHIEVPPALSAGPAKTAAARLQSVIDAGHASDLDEAATCLVLAAVASGKPFPWCLHDAKPAPKTTSNSLNQRPEWMP